jgi:hypothetical protein
MSSRWGNLHRSQVLACYIQTFKNSNFISNKKICMSVDSKHIATFLLGAAAAFAAHKYINMTPEEKQKLSDSLKDKAHQFKSEAETAAEKAKDYFSELKTKGTEVFKEHFDDAENIMHNIFGTHPKNAESAKSA